jgi:hypothetical protein
MYLAANRCVMLRRTMTPVCHGDSEDPLPTSVDRVVDDRLALSPQVFRSKVYRDKETDCWIVEPPRNMAHAVDKLVFTGPRAQQLALTYAYETYGNARFFPY